MVRWLQLIFFTLLMMHEVISQAKEGSPQDCINETGQVNHNHDQLHQDEQHQEEEEEEDEDDDPIVEDINKVDLTNLPVVKRERRPSQFFDCHLREEEVVTYSYHAKTLSGARTEVWLQAVHQTNPEKIEAPFVGEQDSSLRGKTIIIPHLNCYKQDHPILIKEIKDMVVQPNSEKYNFTELDYNIHGEVGQPLEVDNLVFGGQLKNGFFIEAGGSDFEHHSDTLHFEINHGWSGLFVEPNPLLFSKGQRKNRKAQSIQACLSTELTPQVVDFDMIGVWLGEEDESKISMGGIVTDGREGSVKIQCFPLYSMLLAIGNPTVNYFSLDIEGAEFAVLKTIPWDKVDIQVLTVESHMLNDMFPGTKEEMIEYMKSVGYQHIQNGHSGTNELRESIGTTDELFVKNGIQLKNTNKKDEL